MQLTASAARRGFFASPRPFGRALFAGCASLLAIIATACGGSTVEYASGSSSGDGGDGTSTTTTAGVGGGGVGGGSSSSGSAAGGGPITDECGPIGDIGSIDLGQVSLKIAKAFTICDNTVGFTALVSAPKNNDVIGVARLKPPAGNSVLLNFAMANHTTAVFANYGWILASDPQSLSADAFPVQPGKWQITLGDDDGSITQAETSVWYRRTSDGQFHGGVVDVNVFLVSGAATQSFVTSVLDKMFPFGGLDLGTVQFFPLDSSFTTISSQDELAAMFQTSVSLTTMPSLNLFVIGNFGQAFGDAIGVAGGIPGSPMQHGNGRSGLAYQPSNDADYDASVLRHETGHITGLFHTTEYSIDETDPLDDTPSCAHSVITNKPQNCPDTFNEMFPIAFGSLEFTPNQETVIQGSMLYRGIVTEGGKPVPPQPVIPPSGASELKPLAPETAADIERSPMARRPQHVWRSGADPVERVLGAVWCAHGGADYTDLAARVAGPSASERLRSIALDPGAADLIRARALKAYVRAASKDRSPVSRRSAVDLASSFAKDESAGVDLRISALRSLAEVDAPAALAAKRLQAAASSALVRSAADKLQIMPAVGAPSSGSRAETPSR